jgi:ABC-2 type transport system permease protein
MRRLAANWPAYLQIVSLNAQVVFAYRTGVAIELTAMLLKIFLLKVVWTAVYAGRGVVDDVALREVITFTTLANLQFYLLFSNATSYLYSRIREGLIALDLARPVPFLGQLMAHQVGGTAAFGPYVLLAAPFAFLVGGIQPPASLAAGGLYLVSLLLAYLVTTMIGILVGLLAFWTLEIWGIHSIVNFVSQFFSGALVPLWFFPPVMRDIANWLPFQAQAFLPLSIFLGRIEGWAVAEALAVQLLWVAVLGAFVVLVWRRAMRRVVVQGG